QTARDQGGCLRAGTMRPEGRASARHHGSWRFLCLGFRRSLAARLRPRKERRRGRAFPGRAIIAYILDASSFLARSARRNNKIRWLKCRNPIDALSQTAWILCKKSPWSLHERREALHWLTVKKSIGLFLLLAALILMPLAISPALAGCGDPPSPNVDWRNCNLSRQEMSKADLTKA